LHNVIRTKVITQYLRVSGIKIATIDKGRAEKKALTRKKNKIFEPLKTTHQRYSDVFSTLGYPLNLQSYVIPQRKKLTTKLQNLIGTAPKKLIGIAPFAAFKSKMYPLELIKKIIAKINETQQYRIFLFGGGIEEIEILKKLEAEYSSVDSIAGVLSFSEELTFISNLDLMLSMDSANGHLAAMFGIPVITIWGVTHPYAGFAPFAQPEENGLYAERKQYPLIPTSVYGNKYPKGYENAIKTIAPETAINKILELI